MTSFSERLVAVHRELDEIFLQYAERLLDRELDRARAVLGAYRELLFLHIEHEEASLLPRYAALGPIPRFPLVLYTGQHEKIRGMVDELVTRTAALGGDARAVRRGIIALFDRHATFKHLMEHHDGAERAGLFPALDGLADPPPDGADAWWTRHRAHAELWSAR